MNKIQQWLRKAASQSLNTTANNMCCMLIEWKIIHIHCNDFHWPCPSIRTPAPVNHEIDNFGRPFLGHHYWALNILSESCPGEETEEDF